MTRGKIALSRLRRQLRPRIARPTRRGSPFLATDSISGLRYPPHSSPHYLCELPPRTNLRPEFTVTKRNLSPFLPRSVCHSLRPRGIGPDVNDRGGPIRTSVRKAPFPCFGNSRYKYAYSSFTYPFSTKILTNVFFWRI